MGPLELMRLDAPAMPRMMEMFARASGIIHPTPPDVLHARSTRISPDSSMRGARAAAGRAASRMRIAVNLY